MKITITQGVTIEGERFPHKWYRECVSEVIPHEGGYIQDAIWKGGEYYMVTEVIIDYKANECMVTVKEYQDVIPSERKEVFAHMAKLQGWKCSWRMED